MNAPIHHVWKRFQPLGLALLLHAGLALFLLFNPIFSPPKPISLTHVEFVVWPNISQKRAEIQSDAQPPGTAQPLNPVISPPPEPVVMTPSPPDSADVVPLPFKADLMEAKPTPSPIRVVNIKPRKRKKRPQQAVQRRQSIKQQTPTEKRTPQITIPVTTQRSTNTELSSPLLLSGQHKERPGRDGEVRASKDGGRSRMYTPPRSDADYLNNPKPNYPAFARRRGLQGVVVLAVEVDSSGLPLAVSVKRGSGYKILDRSALLTVQQWRFIPAQRGGTPVRATVNIPIRFQLMDS